MHMTAEGSSRDREQNNFGFLRLALAILVIFSHSPELIDGNRSREVLTRLFGTLSFGELAVDGFFLISGYLILQSFLNSRSYGEYLIKRVLRIYPGYVVAFMVSLFIGWAGGGRLVDLRHICLDITRALSLHTPEIQNAFSGTAVPALNGSMWTVSYEFRCYLLVMLLGVLGLFRNRRLYLAVTAIFFLLALKPVKWLPSPMVVALFGHPEFSLRFTLIFLCGGCFYLFRDRIRYKRTAVLIAAVALLPLMYIPRLAEPAVITIGAYLLFSFAFIFKSRVLGRVGSRVDLSYGVYLYAWPIQGLLIWHNPHISPWVLFLLSAMAAGCCAFVSWTVIEKPFLNLKGRFVRSRRTNATSALGVSGAS